MVGGICRAAFYGVSAREALMAIGYYAANGWRRFAALNATLTGWVLSLIIR